MKERDKWEEGTVKQKKKKQAFGDLSDSQTIQITKNAKIRKFIVGKACSGKRVKDVAGQPFA